MLTELLNTVLALRIAASRTLQPGSRADEGAKAAAAAIQSINLDLTLTDPNQQTYK